jgi:hypothetical protein
MDDFQAEFKTKKLTKILVPNKEIKLFHTPGTFFHIGAIKKPTYIMDIYFPEQSDIRDFFKKKYDKINGTIWLSIYFWQLNEEYMSNPVIFYVPVLDIKCDVNNDIVLYVNAMDLIYVPEEGAREYINDNFKTSIVNKIIHYIKNKISTKRNKKKCHQ